MSWRFQKRYHHDTFVVGGSCARQPYEETTDGISLDLPSNTSPPGRKPHSPTHTCEATPIQPRGCLQPARVFAASVIWTPPATPAQSLSEDALLSGLTYLISGRFALMQCAMGRREVASDRGDEGAIRRTASQMFFNHRGGHATVRRGGHATVRSGHPRHPPPQAQAPSPRAQKLSKATQ